jgi:hypothetical protein
VYGKYIFLSQPDLSSDFNSFIDFLCSCIWHFTVPMAAPSVAAPRTGVTSKNKTELRPPGTVTENDAVTAAKGSGTRRTRKNAASDSEDE